jgi:hypothetical protein
MASKTDDADEDSKVDDGLRYADVDKEIPLMRETEDELTADTLAAVLVGVGTMNASAVRNNRNNTASIRKNNEGTSLA